MGLLDSVGQITWYQDSSGVRQTGSSIQSANAQDIPWLGISWGYIMDPFIVEVSRQIDSYQSREEIMRILDELEFLFEALGEEQQDACSRLMSLLEERLRSQA
jgi:hypothetical protein